MASEEEKGRELSDRETEWEWKRDHLHTHIHARTEICDRRMVGHKQKNKWAKKDPAKEEVKICDYSRWEINMLCSRTFSSDAFCSIAFAWYW